MIYFTSDSHFGHSKIIQYCNRPFKSVEEMDETIIQNWNKTVKSDDTIYHLGDFGLAHPNKLATIWNRLNGYKILCEGSHDKDALKFVPALYPNTMITIGPINIFLSHYLHKVWPLSHYNSWHLVGHSHGTMNDYIAKEGKILDVGVDSHDFTPWSLIEVAEVMETRPNNFNYINKNNNHVGVISINDQIKIKTRNNII